MDTHEVFVSPSMTDLHHRCVGARAQAFHLHKVKHAVLSIAYVRAQHAWRSDFGREVYCVGEPMGSMTLRQVYSYGPGGRFGAPPTAQSRVVLIVSRTSYAPKTMHGVVVHIWMLYFPIFLLRMCNTRSSLTAAPGSVGTTDRTVRMDRAWSSASGGGGPYRLNIV